MMGLALMVTAAGCEDDDEDTPAATTDGGDDPADGGDDPADGGDDPGDGGDDPGDGGMEPGEDVVCGDVTCEPVASPVPATLCCTEGTNLCGVNLGPISMNACLQLNAPGDLDPNCPDIDVMGVELPGCCTPAGICGGQDSLLGLGCTIVDPMAGACGAGLGDGSTDGG